VTITQSAEETSAFGRRACGELVSPLIVWMRGDLGAGRTTLVKGMRHSSESRSRET